jgi:hypothetical protein
VFLGLMLEGKTDNKNMLRDIMKEKLLREKRK